MENYIPQFKVKAKNAHESAEISNMFVNMMNKMDYNNLLKVARKINANPEKKVKKMENYVGLL